MKRTVCVAMAVVAMAATGANNTWSAKDGSYDGDYSDAAHWGLKRVPESGDTAAFPGGQVYTITFPKTVLSTPANWVWSSSGAGVATFDGRGATLAQADDGNYATWASANLSGFFKYERSNNNLPNYLTKGAFAFTDFLFSLTGTSLMDVQQGTLDISKVGGGRVTAFNEGSGLGKVVIRAGAALVMGQLDYRGQRSSAIDVDGGSLTAGTFTLPTSEGGNVGPYTHDLTVRNGGTLTLSSMGVNGHSTRGPKHTLNLKVETDGLVNMPNGNLDHTYGGFSLAQSGGELKAAEINVAGGAGSVASVDLTGGTLQVYRIAANATGTSSFHADGGTIKARQDRSDFLKGFNAATLGADGLTLDTDHAITVAQSFTDAEGAAGRLVKTGTGTLTLTGTASAFDTLELRGGGLVLGDGAGTRAKLLVANGCMPTISGSALDGMLTGLSLGDATTKGRLAVTSGATLRLDGPLALPNAQVVLSGGFETGTTYDLIVAKGADTATAAAWRELVVREGTAPGQSYVFDAAYDADAGTTTFRMTVSEAAIVEKHATEDETLAALALDPYDTYAATVDEGVTLSVANSFTCGILVKDGLGRMTLATDLAAVFSCVRLLDGTLAFASPFAALDVPLTVDKASGTTVIHTADDVTFRQMSVTSGGWVKHGPGTLTVVNDGSAVQKLTATNGCVSRDGTPGGTEVRLGPDTPPPTTSWTGLSIAEGTVWLKGTGAGAKFNMPHSVAVGMPTRDGTAQPKLVVDACEAWTGNNAYHFFLAPNAPASAAAYFATAPELVVTNGAKMRVDTLCVGDQCNDIACRPKMTVDGSTFLSGFKLQFNRSNTEQYRPEYVFRNGARVLSAMEGTEAQRGSSTIEIAGAISLVCDNSLLARGGSYSASPAAVSMYAGNSKAPATLEFRNGAEFWCWQLATSTALNRLDMIFDGATWEFGAGTNLCVEKTEAVNLEVKAGGLTAHATTANPLRIRQPFTGAGVLTKTGSATMWFDTRANWSGGAAVAYAADPVTLACDVKVAEGGLAISPGAASGTNLVTLAAGTTLDLLGGSVGGLILSGSGTISGGTLAAPVLRPAFDAAWQSTNGVVTLAADCAVSGKLLVDLGRGAENPLLPPYPRDILVARYAGDTSPDVSAWNVLATGGAKGFRGKFAAADGEIRMTVTFPSTVIVIR